jgi:hypothetical protein
MTRYCHRLFHCAPGTAAAVQVLATASIAAPSAPHPLPRLELGLHETDLAVEMSSAGQHDVEFLVRATCESVFRNTECAFESLTLRGQNFDSLDAVTSRFQACIRQSRLTSGNPIQVDCTVFGLQPNDFDGGPQSRDAFLLQLLDVCFASFTVLRFRVRGGL